MFYGKNTWAHNFKVKKDWNINVLAVSDAGGKRHKYINRGSVSVSRCRFSLPVLSGTGELSVQIIES